MNCFLVQISFQSYILCIPHSSNIETGHLDMFPKHRAWNSWLLSWRTYFLSSRACVWDFYDWSFLWIIYVSTVCKSSDNKHLAEYSPELTSALWQWSIFTTLVRKSIAHFSLVGRFQHRSSRSILHGLPGNSIC